MWFLEGLLRHRSFPFATDTCHGATGSAHTQSMTLLFDCPTPRHCAAQSRQQASGEASFSGRVHRPSFQRTLFRQSRQVSSAVTRSKQVTRRSSRGVTSHTVNSLGGLEQVTPCLNFTQVTIVMQTRRLLLRACRAYHVRKNESRVQIR